MANERVMLLDTTLRDGEQSAGIGMTGAEKMEIARQLQRMNVDIIEAGFAASSPGDFEAVSNIAKEIKGPIIASLARAHPNDVDQAWRAVQHSERPRIHVFLSSSEIHQMHQLRKNREEVMEMAVNMVERAKSYCPDVEFSPMDATRTNPEYLYMMLAEVIGRAPPPSTSPTLLATRSLPPAASPGSCRTSRPTCPALTTWC